MAAVNIVPKHSARFLLMAEYPATYKSLSKHEPCKSLRIMNHMLRVCTWLSLQYCAMAKAKLRCGHIIPVVGVSWKNLKLCRFAMTRRVKLWPRDWWPHITRNSVAFGCHFWWPPLLLNFYSQHFCAHYWLGIIRRIHWQTRQQGDPCQGRGQKYFDFYFVLKL